MNDVIIFKPSEVLPSITQLAQLCSGKNLIKMLDSLRFETCTNGIRVTTSDGETWMTLTLPMHHEITKSTKFCIDAVKFTQGLRALDGDAETKLTLNNTAHIASFKYPQGHFELPFVDADEYPMASKEGNGELSTLKLGDIAVLFNGINATVFATDNDVLRPQMAGIHIDFVDEYDQQKVVFVATDTRKLVRYKVDTNFDASISGKGFTLPKKPATLIANYINMNNGDLGEVEITFDDSKFSFHNDQIELSTRLSAGRYPNYNLVLQEYPNDKVAIVKRDDFVASLKRVAPFGNQKTQMVALKFTLNEIQITAQDIDYNTSATEKFQCQYTGDDLEIGFPCGGLIDVIKNVRCEEVKIKLIDVNRAGMIEPNVQADGTDYVSIQMPMML